MARAGCKDCIMPYNLRYITKLWLVSYGARCVYQSNLKLAHCWDNLSAVFALALLTYMTDGSHSPSGVGRKLKAVSLQGQ